MGFELFGFSNPDKKYVCSTCGAQYTFSGGKLSHKLATGHAKFRLKKMKKAKR